METSGNYLWAGTSGKASWDNNIFISTDSGKSWSHGSSGVTSGRITVLSAVDTTLFAGHDDGSIWQGTFAARNLSNEVNNGYNYKYVFALALRDSFLSYYPFGYEPSTLFAGTDSGVYVYVCVYNGNGPLWSYKNKGLSNIKVHSLILSGNALFAGTESGGVFVSSDNGTSWLAINAGLTENYISSITINNATLFATSSNNNVARIWRRPLSDIVTLPGIVSLGSPVNNTKINADSVLLVWHKGTPSITKYMLQVATDSGMSKIFFQDSTLTDTTKLIKSISGNVTYWWRVKAFNAAGWGTFCLTNTFVHNATTAILPKQFEILSFDFNGSSMVLHYSLSSQSYVSLK